ncbi:MAG TPA: hypothetical protein DCO89_01455, partial [Clostridiales bacterium]|nr:hypothetical protein [Clostridiales bacterium]
HGGELKYNFTYGINDFVCDTSLLKTGLNDSANVVYTLTGDDLRYVKNQVATLPQIHANLYDDDALSYWTVQLIKANVYTSENQIEPTVLYFTPDNNAENSNYTCNGENYKIAGSYNFSDTIVKIEYVFRVVINSGNAETYFKTYGNDAINCNFICSTKIADLSGDTSNIITEKFERELKDCKFSIVRQKVDTVLLDYYANAEKVANATGDEVYEINEMPSDGIIAGTEGILKIYIGPQNAEVNEIEVSYSNASYNLSMRQMLKYESVVDGNETISYVPRKPYAIAINNGKGLNLYKESNYKKGESGEPVYNYDGYIYVACLIPSSVPSGQKFGVDVTVTFNNKYKLTSHKELISKLASQISINYKFKNQTLDSFAYVAKNVETKFYVDFTEIVETPNDSDLATIFGPSIFTIECDKSAEAYQIEIIKDEIEFFALRQTYRVPYKLILKDICSLKIQAKMQKANNNIITNIQSNAFEFRSVLYLIDEIKIVDGGNEILSIKQSSPTKPKVELKIIFDENIEASQLTIINDAKTTLENEIGNKISYWFGMQQGENIYSTLSDKKTYTSYNVIESGETFTIGVKQINSTAVIYVEVPFNYANVNILSNEISTISTYITENKVGLQNNGTTDNPIYIHYLRDSVTLSLTSDVSDEFAIPIRNQAEFEAMTNGVDQTAYYALDNDIELVNYTPRDLKNISLNGNMHTINIKNFNVVESAEGENVVYRSNYGLFNNVDENSVIKNLNVNYSGLVNIENHTSNDEYDIAYYNLYNQLYNTYQSDDNDSKKFAEIISNNNLLYTTGFNATAINFGGVVVDNYGVIYNVSVTSKKMHLIEGNSATQEGRKIFDEYVDCCEYDN